MSEQEKPITESTEAMTIESETQVIESNPEPTVEPVIKKPEPVYGEVVNTYKLNIRSSCFMKNRKNIKQVLSRGDKVELLLDRPASEGWVKVKLSDGTTGFTMKDYIEVVK